MWLHPWSLLLLLTLSVTCPAGVTCPRLKVQPNDTPGQRLRWAARELRPRGAGTGAVDEAPTLCPSQCQTWRRSVLLCRGSETVRLLQLTRCARSMSSLRVLILQSSSPKLCNCTVWNWLKIMASSSSVFTLLPPFCTRPFFRNCGNLWPFNSQTNFPQDHLANASHQDLPYSKDPTQHKYRFWSTLHFHSIRRNATTVFRNGLWEIIKVPTRSKRETGKNSTGHNKVNIKLVHKDSKPKETPKNKKHGNSSTETPDHNNKNKKREEEKTENSHKNDEDASSDKTDAQKSEEKENKASEDTKEEEKKDKETSKEEASEGEQTKTSESQHDETAEPKPAEKSTEETQTTPESAHPEENDDHKTAETESSEKDSKAETSEETTKEDKKEGENKDEIDISVTAKDVEDKPSEETPPGEAGQNEGSKEEIVISVNEAKNKNTAEGEEAHEQKSSEEPAEETTEAPAEETTEAPAEETTEAPAEEKTEANAQENTEETAQENAEATDKENTEENAEANAQENTESTDQKHPEATDQEHPEATPQENTEATPQENTEETPQENTEETPQENTEETPQENTEETPQENTEETPQENTEAVEKENTEAAEKESTEAPASENAEATEKGESNASESSAENGSKSTEATTVQENNVSDNEDTVIRSGITTTHHPHQVHIKIINNASKTGLNETKEAKPTHEKKGNHNEHHNLKNPMHEGKPQENHNKPSKTKEAKLIHQKTGSHEDHHDFEKQPHAAKPQKNVKKPETAVEKEPSGEKGQKGAAVFDDEWIQIEREVEETQAGREQMDKEPEVAYPRRDHPKGPLRIKVKLPQKDEAKSENKHTSNDNAHEKETNVHRGGKGKGGKKSKPERKSSSGNKLHQINIFPQKVILDGKREIPKNGKSKKKTKASRKNKVKNKSNHDSDKKNMHKKVQPKKVKVKQTDKGITDQQKLDAFFENLYKEDRTEEQDEDEEEDEDEDEDKDEEEDEDEDEDDDADEEEDSDDEEDGEIGSRYQSLASSAYSHPLPFPARAWDNDLRDIYSSLHSVQQSAQSSDFDNSLDMRGMDSEVDSVAPYGSALPLDVRGYVSFIKRSADWDGQTGSKKARSPAEDMNTDIVITQSDKGTDIDAIEHAGKTAHGEQHHVIHLDEHGEVAGKPQPKHAHGHGPAPAKGHAEHPSQVKVHSKHVDHTHKATEHPHHAGGGEQLVHLHPGEKAELHEGKKGMDISIDTEYGPPTMLEEVLFALGGGLFTVLLFCCYLQICRRKDGDNKRRQEMSFRERWFGDGHKEEDQEKLIGDSHEHDQAPRFSTVAEKAKSKSEPQPKKVESSEHSATDSEGTKAESSEPEKKPKKKAKKKKKASVKKKKSKSETEPEKDEEKETKEEEETKAEPKKRRRSSIFGGNKDTDKKKKGKKDSKKEKGREKNLTAEEKKKKKKKKDKDDEEEEDSKKSSKRRKSRSKSVDKGSKKRKKNKTGLEDSTDDKGDKKGGKKKRKGSVSKKKHRHHKHAHRSSSRHERNSNAGYDTDVSNNSLFLAEDSSFQTSDIDDQNHSNSCTESKSEQTIPVQNGSHPCTSQSELAPKKSTHRSSRTKPPSSSKKPHRRHHHRDHHRNNNRKAPLDADPDLQRGIRPTLRRHGFVAAYRDDDQGWSDHKEGLGHWEMKSRGRGGGGGGVSARERQRMGRGELRVEEVRGARGQRSLGSMVASLAEKNIAMEEDRQRLG